MIIKTNILNLRIISHLFSDVFTFDEEVSLAELKFDYHSYETTFK